MDAIDNSRRPDNYYRQPLAITGGCHCYSIFMLERYTTRFPIIQLQDITILPVPEVKVRQSLLCILTTWPE